MIRYSATGDGGGGGGSPNSSRAEACSGSASKERLTFVLPVGVITIQKRRRCSGGDEAGGA